MRPASRRAEPGGRVSALLETTEEHRQDDERHDDQDDPQQDPAEAGSGTAVHAHRSARLPGNMRGRRQLPGITAPLPGSRHSVTLMTRGGRLAGRLLTALIAVACILVVIVVLSAVHLLPQLRNPFTQTTTDRSGPALLKSITAMSRYEAASGSFQIVVDLTKRISFMPSFLQGSETLFIGQGSDIAYVDFSQLKGPAIQESRDRSAVSVRLPAAQLEPAVLNVGQSYVYAEQQGLFNRIGNFFSGNPNSQQQVYQIAQGKIETAAKQSPLLADAQRNTQDMLDSMLHSLGFARVTITFA